MWKIKLGRITNDKQDWNIILNFSNFKSQVGYQLENAALDVSEENVTTEGPTQENAPDNAKPVDDLPQLLDATKESVHGLNPNIQENEEGFGSQMPQKEDKSDKQSKKEIEMASHKVKNWWNFIAVAALQVRPRQKEETCFHAKQKQGMFLPWSRNTFCFLETLIDTKSNSSRMEKLLKHEGDTIVPEKKHLSLFCQGLRKPFSKAVRLYARFQK